ncbi:piggyBac transposable element-derived protein 4-like [Schistocerca piceifrons]|uniref:piggyBac transposable element-derived protein 4-like n=1 Tax=Schistocerca piceifrons TaxID=274613 RepID=UPI001F5EA95E|nr:piggyBac transposable element-derived protein 4-like [Schistocerca piceifrons]
MKHKFRFTDLLIIKVERSYTYGNKEVHMCVSVRPRIREHWSKNPAVSCHFCPNILSRDRFLSILRNFHISDNSLAKRKEETGYDPLHKVRSLLDNECANFQHAYTTSRKITIDEGVCKFRGRVYFKQCMPQKPNKYGMKLYMLSESDTGYFWNFSVYAGERSDIVNLVKTLFANLSGKGYTLFTDRFYTSPILASELETAKTALVGTTRKSRQGLPRAIKDLNLQRGELIFRRKGNMSTLC